MGSTPVLYDNMTIGLVVKGFRAPALITSVQLAVRMVDCNSGYWYLIFCACRHRQQNRPEGDAVEFFAEVVLEVIFAGEGGEIFRSSSCFG